MVWSLETSKWILPCHILLKSSMLSFIDTVITLWLNVNTTLSFGKYCINLTRKEHSFNEERTHPHVLSIAKICVVVVISLYILEIGKLHTLSKPERKAHISYTLSWLLQIISKGIYMLFMTISFQENLWLYRIFTLI